MKLNHPHSPAGVVAAPRGRDLLRLKPAETYKSDARTRVWRVEAPPPDGRSFVIKQFQHSPTRQTWAMLVGMHPAQYERRGTRLLQRRGISVAPIVDWGVTFRGPKAKAWLLMPYCGRSLKHRLRKGEFTSHARRMRVLTSVAELTAAMLAHGLFNRDHKASNVLIDDTDRAWLIDAGGVRQEKQDAQRLRMLMALAVTVPPRKVSRAEQVRFLRVVVQRCPELGDVRAVLNRLRALRGRPG